MKPTDLRGILRYVPQFREKTFVVAVDGAADGSVAGVGTGTSAGFVGTVEAGV